MFYSTYIHITPIAQCKEHGSYSKNLCLIDESFKNCFLSNGHENNLKHRPGLLTWHEVVSVWEKETTVTGKTNLAIPEIDL